MSNILTGFNMQGNDPIDNRIVSPSKFETLEEYLQRVPIQKRYYGLSFYALDENNELRHYTFQTSLIEPTIDDDEEEIERLDKELQEHVNNKEIHKTSEEIRSEIVDADIPDTIARVQWTLDKIEEAVNTVMGDIVDGASDEYNTLKKIQDKIVELRTEVESQLYGDDGGEVLKTLEQALKFLNQYKDFIVDIPDNYVNKQDIVDNLNTDDPTKVLSARQGKVLSETLTNYFDSAMASIRAETNRATNAENRIEAKLDSEIDRSTAEDIRIQSELDAEEARAQSEEKRIEGKLDAEIERSTTKDTELGNQIIAETNRAEGEEQRIETKLDNEITRSTAKDADHDSRIEALEGETHVQNTDIGTTSQTFQLQMGKPGNKIKNEDAAISVRNADDSDYANFIAKNATFKGDLIVEGQSFVTEAETVEIKDNILLLNKGEVGSGVTKGMAGLQIDRGTEPDFQILFVESDRRFKAGEEGNLQCLALRDEDGDMLDGMFTTWDSATHRLKTTNIIPSTRKLFFNTNANSLGYTSHVYDSTYTADSFTFTKEAGSLFFSAGTTNLNLDTDKTYFRFYKNLMIPSSIISSGTSISLLNASGATIATFGSPSTINSTLNVANQVIIKGGSDTKLIIQSADADNFNLIESLNSSGTVLSTLGYYGSFWGIDNKKIATEEFANNKFLPLAGGTMTGNIQLPDATSTLANGNISTTAGESLLSWTDNNVYISTNSHSTYIRSGAANLMHVRNGISYTIYDSYNFNPGNYLPLTGGTLTGALTISLSSVAPIILNNTNASATEISQTLRIGGTSKGYFGYTTSTGVFMQNSDSSIICVKSNGAYYGTSTNTLTKLLTSADLSSYATQSWCNSKFAPLDRFNSSTGYTTIKITGQEFNFNSTSSAVYMNYRTPAGATALTQIIWRAGGGADSTALCEGRWGNLYMNDALVATQTWVSSQGFLKTAPSISITTSGSGDVVTGISASGHALTVTKGSASMSVSWNDITGKPSSFPPSAHTHEYIVGRYTGSGGVIAPGSIGINKLQCNMMYVNAESSGGGYCDWILMNAYPWSDVPYATAIGVVKAATPSAYIMSGPNSTDKSTWVRKKLATTDEIPTRTSDLTNNSGFLTSSSLSGYATQSWANGRFLPLSGGKLTGDLSFQEANGIILRPSNDSYISGIFADTQGNECVAVWAKNTVTRLRWHAGVDMSDGTANLMMGIIPDFEITKASGTAIGYIAGNEILHSNNYTSYTVTKTGGGASGTWGISISGNATTATTATNATQLGGTAAASYVKENDNISRLTNDRAYVRSTSTLRVNDIQVANGAAGSTTGVLYVVLES